MEGLPPIRAARREDLPEIVALLADDLGRGRERADNGSLPATYLEAFEEIAWDPPTNWW